MHATSLAVMRPCSPPHLSRHRFSCSTMVGALPTMVFCPTSVPLATRRWLTPFILYAYCISPVANPGLGGGGGLSSLLLPLLPSSSSKFLREAWRGYHGSHGGRGLEPPRPTAGSAVASRSTSLMHAISMLCIFLSTLPPATTLFIYHGRSSFYHGVSPNSALPAASATSDSSLTSEFLLQRSLIDAPS
jgi:hypothetical protein